MKNNDATQLISSAFAAFSNNDARTALQLLEQVIAQAPSNFDALNGAGIVSHKLQDARRAIDYFERAHALNPCETSCAQNLAGLLIQSNQLERALSRFKESLVKHPNDQNLRQLEQMIQDRRTLQRMPILVCSKADLQKTPQALRPADGDHYFALHLKQALQRHGLIVNAPQPIIMLLLHGVMPFNIPRNLYAMLWIHSHPHNLTRELLSQFDCIFSLSPSFTEKLLSLGMPAGTLIGGTAFSPPTTTPSTPTHSIVFVGNARRCGDNFQTRPIIEHMLALGGEWVERLEVWGLGWENILPSYCIKGQYFDNRHLNELYASSVVVLNDHFEDMRTEGFVNPHILDVMAAGGLVLSDDLHDKSRLFGDALLTYTTTEELRQLLSRCFSDPDFRQTMITKGMRAVQKYTFDQTADHITRHLLALDPDALKNHRRRPARSNEGCEAQIVYDGDRVIKKYKPDWFQYNELYARRGEVYYLSRYHSPCFVKVISSSNTELIMQNEGCHVGRMDPRVPGGWRLEPEGLNLVAFITWLKHLESELQRLGLKHRDINPTNILHDAKTANYALIDFSWMIRANDPDGPATHPATLNPYATDDHHAIAKLVHEAVQAQIARINRGKHYDGSSTRAGWVYHPIAFSDYQAPVHKTAAVQELQEVMDYCAIPEQADMSILEVGSSIGYFSFNLARHGCRITAYEADPEACAAAEAMRLAKDINNIRFVNAMFDINALPENTPVYDLTLMLNVHMWIHKALGPESTIALMQRLSEKTRRLIFQTAHAESGGMYRVAELKTTDDIAAYLQNCGFENVRHLRDTDTHGGLRALFLCEGIS